MGRILLVSYSFPPMSGAEVNITMNCVESLAKLGYSVTVLTGKPSLIRNRDVSSLNQIPRDISIYRACSLEDSILDILSYLRFTNSKVVSQLSIEMKPDKVSLKQLFVDILRHIKLLPNHIAGWEFFAVKKGKKILQEQNIMCIVSRSNPVTSHLAALKSKLVYNLPWIACFSDPWTLDPNPSYSNRFLPPKFIEILSKYWERKIIYVADRIVFTTEYQKDLYSKKYSNFADKFIVIPNSFNPDNVSHNRDIEHCEKKDDEFTIVHTGSLFRKRSPEPFLEALVFLKKEEPHIYDNLRIIFVGELSSFTQLIRKFSLYDIIETTGKIPRKDALEYGYIADLLLLIDAPSLNHNIFLPSKLLDYICMNKPILAITPDGASADVIRATKTGTVISSYNPTDIKKSIVSYYNDYVNGNFKINPDWDEINKYSAENCTKTLVKTIESLVNQRKEESIHANR